MIFNKNIWVLIALVAVVFSCKEEQNFTDSVDAKLSFSTDTIQFDTVFSSIGSTTSSFRIYNPNDNAIKTTIQLAGGASSNYRLNIDGYKTSMLQDFEIQGNDSVYVFVEVTVDPQNSNSPMVVEDSIMFYTNGNQQDVKLVSFGQDVNLFNGEVLESQTWIADKPYLIYNSVLVDSLHTLTIEPGVQMFFHHGSGMLVHGTLIANGTLEEPIVFQGDRLEAVYDEVPGQWGHIQIDTITGDKYYFAGVHFLKGSINNIMNYTVVKNAIHGIGVYPYSPQENPHMLQLSNSTVTNMSYYGVFALTSRIMIFNSVIANCGSHAVLANMGGLCEVYHSTIANYLPSYYGSRKASAVGLSNYFSYKDSVVVYELKAIFANTIIDGNIADEIIIDQIKDDRAPFEYKFDHCMIKVDTLNISNEAIYTNVMKIDGPDSLPRFINKDLGDYRLDTLSAAQDRGRIDYARAFPFDFDGVSRLDDGVPDVGAFERVEAMLEE